MVGADGWGRAPTGSPTWGPFQRLGGLVLSWSGVSPGRFSQGHRLLAGSQETSSTLSLWTEQAAPNPPGTTLGRRVSALQAQKGSLFCRFLSGTQSTAEAALSSLQIGRRWAQWGAELTGPGASHVTAGGRSRTVLQERPGADSEARSQGCRASAAPRSPTLRAPTPSGTLQP